MAKGKPVDFVAPQIKILECKKFPTKLTDMEESAHNIFCAVDRGSLANRKNIDFVELAETLVKMYNSMGCRMSLKILNS